MKKLIPTLLLLPLLGLASVSAQTTVNFAEINRLQNGSDTWSLPSVGDNQLLVGRSGSNSNAFMIAFTFDVSAFSSQISAAPSISLTLDYDQFLGTNFASNPFNLELVGFAKSSTAVTAGDATVAGTSVGFINTADLAAAPGSMSYDVTAIAQSLIAVDADFIGFRLTSNLAPNSSPNNRLLGLYRTPNSLTNPMAADGVQLNITPIPEPSAFALLGLGALGLILLRRRRA